MNVMSLVTMMNVKYFVDALVCIGDLENIINPWCHFLFVFSLGLFVIVNS